MRVNISVTDYQYGDNANRKPHAVSKVTINGVVADDYAYDANGNIKTGNGRTVDWTSFNKPKRITNGSAYSQFAYAPDRARYRHTSLSDGKLVTTRYIGGLYERVEADGQLQHRFNIRVGGQVVAVREITTNASADTMLKQALNFLHRDHLGSVRMISGSLDATSGEVEIIERPDFDAWGNRRDLELLKSGNDFQQLGSGLTFKHLR